MTDSTILQSEDLEERYERYKEKIKHFTIMNDIFMRNVLKETEEGVKTMCQELEEIYNEGEQSGFLRGEQSGVQKGELKKARETTLALLEMGMSVKQIAKAVNLSIETVQNWISET